MAGPPFKVKALYEYTSPHEDDLKFPSGQIITVMAEEDADWYYGEYTDTSGEKQEGIFPRNFVDRYEPETPPRPTRSTRPKKEPEAMRTPSIDTERSVEGAGAEQVPTVETGRNSSPQKQIIPNVQPAPPAKKASPPPSPSSSKPTVPAVGDAQKKSADTLASASVRKVAPKPPPSTSEKVSTQEPAAERVGGNSFRDRIAAFNKPAAPPVAPFKPGGLSSSSSGFIKKPFVAPPPSKNSYVPIPREPPPQKLYRREEDPEVAIRGSQDVEPVERAAPVTAAQTANDEEDQPKPTSLKERIALLQKQQLEQAARHAEAAQKKEKPKRPPKKRLESHEGGEDDAKQKAVDAEGDAPATAPRNGSAGNSEEGYAPAMLSQTRSRPPTDHSKAEASPLPPTKAVSDEAEDADQSGAGDDGEEISTGRDDSDEHHRPVAVAAPGSRAPKTPVEEADEEDEENEEEEEEEEEIDREVRRRMEIRERMAKMSGGMGMHGMFGPPGGMPPMPAGGAKKKTTSGTSDKKSGGDTGEAQAHSYMPVQIMALPGMGPRVKSPESIEKPSLTAKEVESSAIHPVTERPALEVPDVEDVVRSTPSISSPQERGGAPPPPTEHRPTPAPPTTGEKNATAPSTGSKGGPPPPPAEARSAPPLPPARPLSPSAGSESDDEMSLYTKGHSAHTPTTDSGPESRAPPPPLRTTGPAVPSRPEAPEDVTSPQSPEGKRNSYFGGGHPSTASPTTPGTGSKRQSRIPPIPTASPAVPSSSQSRPPPPPPPSQPPSRKSTGDGNTITPLTVKHTATAESDEEVTEYEGDYDTDIAAGATHKDALKAHDRQSSYDDSTAEENSVRSPVVPPSNVPPPVPQGPRAMPPPLPVLPPKATRQSMDMPRAAPPPIPATRERANVDQDDEYDPYRYTGANHHAAPFAPVDPTPPADYDDDDDDLYSAPPPRSRQSQLPPPRQDRPPPPPPSVPASSRGPSSTPNTRKSLDVQRTQSNSRRSTEQSRGSGERAHIAGDVDLGEKSHWWAMQNTPPPVFQNRPDLLFEIEESTVNAHGGKNMISKDVYVLFHDYSQTVISVRFDPRNPYDVELSQRHQPPPQTLRQDQLEDAHSRYGQKLSEAAAAKQNTIVGDSNPHTLVLELLKPFRDALPPVGTRAYGALVYANLANASVQQLDEIRSGDIITLRNAKFQGHRGPMHQKYSMEAGKPDHVAVVIDWDGTKKKVRVWEQGRESKKVKMESFKLGDLKSGEVKVWRIMGRSWVGWESPGWVSSAYGIIKA